MAAFSCTRSLARWAAISVGVAAGTYGTYAAVTWFRYGRPARPEPESRDPLLERFMPTCDVAERHHVRVSAPAEITFAAAREADLMESPVARAIFRAREVMLGSEPERTTRPRGLLAMTQSLGWRILAEVPGREVVVGAVTQPWKANVTFRGLPPDDFAAFDEPGYVKIAWTLRADPIASTESVFRTETRAIATDTAARARFRRYWSFLSPGIIVIRAMMLHPLKAEAERRAREMKPRRREAPNPGS